MQINNDLDLVFRSPTDRFEEVVVLPLDVRFTGTNFVGPISNGDAHVIQSKIVQLGSCAAWPSPGKEVLTQHLRLLQSRPQ